MVHIQNADVANRTVVTALWFKRIADQTVSFSLIVIVSDVEPPVQRNFPRRSFHHCVVRPHHHRDADVEEDKDNDEEGERNIVDVSKTHVEDKDIVLN